MAKWFPWANGFVLTTDAYGQESTIRKDKVIEAFDILDATFVAVRSSATKEDWVDDSFAWQFDTFLFVNKENLIKRIEECHKSINNERIKSYCESKGIQKSDIKIAVVIQKMIHSDVAWVAFTINPVTWENEIMIEAWRWLGEAIVSGMITPDNYIVNKESLLIDTLSINQQITKLVIDETIWWIKESEVQMTEQNLQKLSDKKIIELTKIAEKIENEYGKPMDIERAVANDTLYILQARPVTTISKKKNRTELEFIFSQYHPPLFLELWLNDRFIDIYKELASADISVLYYIENNQLDGYMSTNTQEAFYDVLKNKLSKEFFHTQYKRYKTSLKTLKNLEQHINQKENLSSQDLSDALGIIYNATTNSYPLSNIFYVISNALAEIATKKLIDHKIETALIDFLQPWFPTYLENFHEKLYELKTYYFWNKDCTEEQVKLLYDKGGEFKKDLHEFAETYKYMTSINLWVRDPLSFIPDLIHANEKKTPAKAPNCVKKEVDFLNYILFFKDEISTFTIPYVKFAFDKLWKSSSEKLGLSMEDFEQLHIPDIQKYLLTKKSPSTEEIKTKRQATNYYYEPWKGIEITVGYQGRKRYEELKKSYVKRISIEIVSEIKGKTGSVWYAHWIVKIIKSADEIAAFSEGQILVTAYTAPDFVPAMKKAIAIVTDTWGITCHAAIIARELGKPCVIWTKIATQVLKDGDLVEVDADNWVVNILERKDKI